MLDIADFSSASYYSEVRNRLEAQRLEGLRAAFNRFIVKSEPARWAEIPPVATFLKQQKCQEFAYGPNAPPPDAESCDAVVESVEMNIVTWHSKELRRIVKSLSRSSTPLAAPSGEQLNLALSILYCTLCDGGSWQGYGKPRGSAFLFGLKDVSAHISCGFFDHLHTNFQPQTTAIQLMKEVLHRLGLDPKTTTLKDLDDLDPRIACLLCASGPGCGFRRRVCKPCFNWRGFVGLSSRNQVYTNANVGGVYTD